MTSSPDVIGSSRKALPTLQHLSPPLARFCLGIERLSCRELGLVKGTRLLLALSGGADSTALAMVFFLLASRLAVNLSALCVDHSLRPDSGEDVCHVQDFCKSLDIPCSVRRIDVAAYASKYHLGLEEAGRHFRYALLEKERMHLNADWILLGHHAGDLSEDIMLRLIRGTGWPGLAGMTHKDSARGFSALSCLQNHKSCANFCESSAFLGERMRVTQVLTFAEIVCDIRSCLCC